MGKYKIKAILVILIFLSFCSLGYHLKNGRARFNNPNTFKHFEGWKVFRRFPEDEFGKFQDMDSKPVLYQFMVGHRFYDAYEKDDPRTRDFIGDYLAFYYHDDSNRLEGGEIEPVLVEFRWHSKGQNFVWWNRKIHRYPLKLASYASNTLYQFARAER